MRTYPELKRVIQQIKQNGLYVNNEIHGFVYPGVNLSFPGVAVHLCLSGTARIIYDMQEITVRKNHLSIMMPGHFMKTVKCSDDFTYARTVISSELLDEVKGHLFSHEFGRFNSTPCCQLTDEQADHVMASAKLLSAIAMHNTADLQLRRQMLHAQLAVGYEFVNLYRKEQDKQWHHNRSVGLYAHFCDLVVVHYREHRNVKFYAEQLGYSARYFSKFFLNVSNGITALDYIGQYVCTQAKRLMDVYPDKTVKSISEELGFSTTGNFCRYFKRNTGINPEEYKRQETLSD